MPAVDAEAGRDTCVAVENVAAFAVFHHLSESVTLHRKVARIHWHAREEDSSIVVEGVNEAVVAAEDTVVVKALYIVVASVVQRRQPVVAKREIGSQRRQTAQVA